MGRWIATGYGLLHLYDRHSLPLGHLRFQLLDGVLDALNLHVRFQLEVVGAVAF